MTVHDRVHQMVLSSDYSKVLVCCGTNVILRFNAKTLEKETSFLGQLAKSRKAMERLGNAVSITSIACWPHHPHHHHGGSQQQQQQQQQQSQQQQCAIHVHFLRDSHTP